MLAYYLGIDASKGYADFLLLDHTKKPVEKSFQLDDTFAGHRALSNYLHKFFVSRPDSAVFAAVESTGGYENNWYRCLQALASRLPLHVARVNPAWVKGHHLASGKRNRTDPISARDIAEYQIAHAEKLRYDDRDYFPTLRRQWHLIQTLTEHKKHLLQQLEALLYPHLPELLRFCRSGVPMWLLKMLARHASYEELRAAGAEGLCQIPFVSIAKAQRVLTVLEPGVGQSHAVIGQVLKTLAEQILHLEKLIAQQKKLLEQNYQEAETLVKLLLTFKGIGVYSAIGLLINIGEVKRFPTVKQMVAYFGLHPVYQQSGDGNWGYHLSKKGRAEVRALLYMVAWSACQHNPVIKALYARCRAKGMAANAALGVCMHKILRIVYGMLKHNRPFDPDFKAHHPQKLQEEKSSRPQFSARRLQTFDMQAPISRRQSKKRKELIQSQDEEIAMCGIQEPAPSNITLGG